jgi:hypothetical protein
MKRGSVKCLLQVAVRRQFVPKRDVSNFPFAILQDIQ